MGHGKTNPGNSGRFRYRRRISEKMLADGRTRGIQCGKRKRHPTERWKNDMIADRHRRQRRKPRRPGGGATCPCVATLGDYTRVNRLLAFQRGELNANKDGISGTSSRGPAHGRNGNMTTIPKPANLAAGLTATYDAWNRLVEVKDGATVIARYEYLCSCQLATGVFPRKRFCRGVRWATGPRIGAGEATSVAGSTEHPGPDVKCLPAEAS